MTISTEHKMTCGKRTLASVGAAFGALVLALSIPTAAHAANFEEGEVDVVSVHVNTATTPDRWEFRSYNHEEEEPIPAPDAFIIPEEDNGIISEEEDATTAISGGGFRNESGTPVTITLEDVFWDGVGTPSLEIDSQTNAQEFDWAGTPISQSFGANFHGHYTWDFGAPGYYEVTFSVTGGAGITDGDFTYIFVVE